MYKKLTENDRVRIMEVTFKPGETIPVHSHPDHAAIAITDGKLAITAGGRTQEAELKAGQALWTPAESHAATNIGKTTLRLVVIELKEGAKK
jgi:quercetin dioxygenase-like cupin family protein